MKCKKKHIPQKRDEACMDGILARLHRTHKQLHITLTGEKYGMHSTRQQIFCVKNGYVHGYYATLPNTKDGLFCGEEIWEILIVNWQGHY